MSRFLTNIYSYSCILIELITNNYLFAGANDAEQLDLIFRGSGTPSEESWPGVTLLPGWGNVEKKKARYPPQDLNEVFGLYVAAPFLFLPLFLSSSLPLFPLSFSLPPSHLHASLLCLFSSISFL